MANFFMRPPTLKANNFAALSYTDPIFTALKDLNLLKKHTKNYGLLLEILDAFQRELLKTFLRISFDYFHSNL